MNEVSNKITQIARQLRARLLPQKAQYQDSDISFELDGRVFSNPRLLSRKAGVVTSKAGSVSWFALVDGKPVKIYECQNKEHAAFIEDLSRHSLLKNHFPACLLRSDRYLVVEWVQGHSLRWRQIKQDRKLLDQIVALQANLHAQLRIGEDPVDYSGYMDYLKRRLQQFKVLLPIDDVIERIYDDLDESEFFQEMRISHPDFTADNLVLEAGTGTLKLIDNELLTQNRYYLIDLFNTYWSFGPNHRKDLLELYLTRYISCGGSLATLVTQERFFSALWNLRLIGTFLHRGNIGEAYQLAEQYRRGALDTHPIIQFAKENRL